MNKHHARVNVQKGANEWAGVYTDGERALAEAQTRVRKIRRGLKWVKNQIEKGEPLPDSLKETLGRSTPNAQPTNA
jgi:hypothetical protein